MIRRTTRTTLLLCLIATVSQAQVTNGGFENWTNQLVYENPDVWRTGNGELSSYVQTTKLSTGVPDGNHAARMETVINGNDTVFGYMIMGNFDDDMASNGVPFTTSISYINAQLRYDIQPGDSAIMIFTAWQGGGVASAQEIKIGGSQTTWMNWNYFLDTPVQFVDSVMLAIACSDPFNGTATNGSWLEIDNVQLLDPMVMTPDLLPNHSFEDWTDVFVEDPDDWSTYNELTQSFGVTTVTKSTVASMGNFSAKVSTHLLNGDTIPGILTNGQLGTNGFTGGVPYAALPTLFSGQYQYVPAGSDTAFISVFFKENGAIIGAVGTQITGTATAWTPFNEPIFILGSPDTMQIVIFAGSNPNSELWVDELDLSGGTVSIIENATDHISLFPSPATNELFVTVADGAMIDQLRIVSMSGTTIEVAPPSVATGMITVPVANLALGAYLLEVVQGENITRKRFLKQ